MLNVSQLIFCILGDLTKIISEAGNEDTKKVVEHLLEARLLREVPKHGDLLVVTGLEAMSNTQVLLVATYPKKA